MQGKENIIRNNPIIYEIFVSLLSDRFYSWNHQFLTRFSKNLGLGKS